MRIELLWWEGCPSHPEALEDLERILEEEGVKADVDLVEIETDEQAQAERFAGSPTIRVDGEDLLPGEAGSRPFSLTCRIYRLRDGRASPTPDPDDLREALRRAL
jgi:hypothetical protein